MSLGAPELEAFAADAVSGEIGRASKHALPLGTPCPNCATPLQGPWCHECGQKGEEYQRSIWHLVAEAFEGMTHFDSRFWNTLPRLAVRPGRLTADYLAGHRASQIPPFRLFLIVLLLVFFAGGLGFSQGNGQFRVATPDDPKVTAGMSPKDKADYEEAISRFKTVRAKGGLNFTDSKGASSVFWNTRAKKALENPEAFLMVLEQWGHRFAILLLPIAALMLSALFPFRKDTFVFDHLIFAMHSLSFQGLLLSICFVAGIWFDWTWYLLWLAPVHLFVHMRGAYRTGILGTLLRMAALFFGSSLAVAFLTAGLLIVGLASVH